MVNLRSATGLLTAAVLVAACSSSSTSAPPAASGSGQANGGACSLQILGPTRTQSGEQAAYEAVFAAFKQEFGCTVTATWQGQWSDIPQELDAARLANQPVDIVYDSTFNTTLAESGSLMDLTQVVSQFKDRFPASALADYTLGDHVWAIPFSDISTTFVYYNKTMFQELGLDVPKTYQDLVSVAEKIKSTKGIDPMIHRGKEPGYWPIWFMAAYAQTTGNQSIADTEDFLSGKRPIDSDQQAAQTLEEISQFYKDGILGQDSLATDGPGMEAAFLQQKAAMFFDGSWDLPDLRNANPSFEVGAFAFPQVQSGATQQSAGAADNGWAISSSTKNFAMAAQFLEFLTRPDNATKILSTFDPLDPSVVGVASGDDPLAQQITSDFRPNTIEYLDWIWPTEVTDAMSQAIPAALTGAQTPQAALASVQQAYQTLVSQKQYVFDWWTGWTSDQWAKVTPSQVPQLTIGQ